MGISNALSCAAVATLTLLVGCDPPPSAVDAAARDVPTVRAPVDAGPAADRTLVRKAISFYRWLHTDPPTSGGDGQGIEHGTIHLTLLVEVHRNPRREGWIQIGALGAQIAVAQNPHLRAVGSTLTWSLPEDAHNDTRMEIFGGEVRTDEPVRAFLSTHPEQSVEITPANTPTMVRLPLQATLPPGAGASMGQYDTFVVVVIPMRNRAGRRYLVQALDMNAEPGGFSQNGVMAHPPSRTEVERFVHWMRDPQGAALNRPPPIAMRPIDRS